MFVLIFLKLYFTIMRFKRENFGEDLCWKNLARPKTTLYLFHLVGFTNGYVIVQKVLSQFIFLYIF